MLENNEKVGYRRRYNSYNTGSVFSSNSINNTSGKYNFNTRLCVHVFAYAEGDRAKNKVE